MNENEIKRTYVHGLKRVADIDVPYPVLRSRLSSLISPSCFKCKTDEPWHLRVCRDCLLRAVPSQPHLPLRFFDIKDNGGSARITWMGKAYCNSTFHSLLSQLSVPPPAVSPHWVSALEVFLPVMHPQVSDVCQVLYLLLASSSPHSLVLAEPEPREGITDHLYGTVRSAPVTSLLRIPSSVSFTLSLYSAPNTPEYPAKLEAKMDKVGLSEIAAMHAVTVLSGFLRAVAQVASLSPARLGSKQYGEPVPVSGGRGPGFGGLVGPASWWAEEITQGLHGGRLPVFCGSPYLDFDMLAMCLRLGLCRPMSPQGVSRTLAASPYLSNLGYGRWAVRRKPVVELSTPAFRETMP